MSFRNNNNNNNMMDSMQNGMRSNTRNNGSMRAMSNGMMVDMDNDMMSTMTKNMMCNIIIQNNSGSRGNYVFCCAAPECNGYEAQTTAWVCAEVPQNGSHCVSTNDQVFAWTGTCSDSRSNLRQESLSQGSLVRNGCVTPVQMGDGRCCGTTAHMTMEHGMPTFGHSTMDARKGMFEIECDNNMRGQEDMLVGMAKVGAHGIVAPVAVMQARPNQTISMRPRMRFYVCEEDCQVGEIVDVERMSSNACVDFYSGRGRNCNTAVITHCENGQYNIQYYDMQESREIMQAMHDGQLKSHLQRRQNNNNNNQHRQQMNGMMNNGDDQLRELTQLTATLTRLLSNMNIHGSEADSESAAMRWIGRVNWPTAITINTASQGANMIAQHLMTRGYRAEFRTLTNSDGTKTAEFTVSRNNNMSQMASDPEADWLAALKADTQSDGHTNGGFNPAPGLDRAAMSKAQKRMSLLQMRGVLDQFQNGQRGEYNERNMGYGNNNNNMNQQQNQRYMNGQANGNLNGHMEQCETSNGVY